MSLRSLLLLVFCCLTTHLYAADWGVTDADFGVLDARGLAAKARTTEQSAALHTAADAGDADAMVLLGIAYLNGVGQPNDPARAVALLQAAAERGHPRGMSAWGTILANGLAGQAQDIATATRWLTRAAEAGNALALYNIVRLPLDGPLTDERIATAIARYRRAAELGLPVAQLELGRAIRDGIGAPKSPAEAARWFERAAAQGDVEAMWDLALLHHLGRAGNGDPATAVVRNTALAARWYRHAAEAGLPRAMNSLAAFLQEGDGVAKNEAEAMQWYQRAARAGDPDATINLLALAVRMNGNPDRTRPTGRVLLIRFAKQDCAPCTAFDRDVLGNAVVAALHDANTLQIAVDPATVRDFAERASVRTLPTTIAYVDGKGVQRHDGPLELAAYIDWLATLPVVHYVDLATFPASTAAAASQLLSGTDCVAVLANADTVRAQAYYAAAQVNRLGEPRICAVVRSADVATNSFSLYFNDNGGTAGNSLRTVAELTSKIESLRRLVQLEREQAALEAKVKTLDATLADYELVLRLGADPEINAQNSEGAEKRRQLREALPRVGIDPNEYFNVGTIRRDRIDAVRRELEARRRQQQ